MERSRLQLHGIDIQEKVALLLERYYPNCTILSQKTHGHDIIISNGNGIYLKGEVKSAMEYFWNTWDKKPHRGMFNVFENELDVNFFVFVVKFVNHRYIWNKEFEVFFVYGNEVKNFVKPRLYKKVYKGKGRSYNLKISDIVKLNPIYVGLKEITMDDNDFLLPEPLPNIRKKIRNSKF